MKTFVNHIFRYYRECLQRDLLLFAGAVALLAGFYLVAMQVPGIWYGTVRIHALRFWIVLVAVYTFSTLFAHYQGTGRIYATVLLPVPVSGKFFWEWFRTLALFGGMTFGAMLCIDGWVARLFWGDAAAQMQVQSLPELLTRGTEPLNYIPALLYALVLVHSALLFIRSFLAKAWVAALAVFAVLLSGISVNYFLGIGLYAHAAYPYLSVESAWDNVLGFSISWCSKTAGYFLSYLFLFLLPAMLIVLSYFRFKEAEIK